MRTVFAALFVVSSASMACDEQRALTPEPAPPVEGSPPLPVESALDATAAEPEAADAAAPARPNLRILFVGNSYTYVHDVPGILTRIAATADAGPTIVTDQVVAGGATLSTHWQDGIAQTRISEKSWTHVVLQGQSFEPTGTDNDDFLAHAKLFGDLAMASGARATWFVTWARGAGAFPPSLAAHSTRRMQDELTSAYAAAARSVPQSLLTCVGEAFRASLRDHPEIALHDVDNSHATLAGAYLAASTFYVAIAGAPVPAASEVPGNLEPGVAAKLRDAANVGSNCADVRVPGDVRLFGEGFHQDDLGNAATPGDFGTSITPVERHVYVSNTGFTDVDLFEPTLTPPFGWTSGAYPGAAGVDPINGFPYCTTVLAAGGTCALAVRYDGSTTRTQAMTLRLTRAYQSEVVEVLSGRTTDRAHLSVRRTDPSVTTFVTTGTSSTFHAVVTNDGAREASAIAPSVGPSLPFEWSGAGVYPGGSGSVDVEGSTVNHCTRVLAAGSRCVLTFRITAPVAYTFYRLPIELTYESSASPSAPIVADSVRASLAVRSRAP